MQHLNIQVSLSKYMAEIGVTLILLFLISTFTFIATYRMPRGETARSDRDAAP